MLFILVAIAIPSDEKPIESKKPYAIATGTPSTLKPLAMRKLRAIIIVELSNITIESPTALPNNTNALGEGATNVSFKKPNCLSNITDIPLMKDPMNTLMEIIPVARKVT